MRRTWWVGAAVAAVCLPIAALAVAVAVVDPNDFKPRLAAAVQDATGRTVTLGGALRISRSLWPTIEVSDVRLANLPGGSRPDMARAERIEAQISVSALLRRRIEVTNLTLIGPNILFEEVGGKPNWVFAPATPPPAPSAPRTSLRLRNVHVQNGMVTFRLPARTKVVGIRSLDLQHLTDDGPLDLATVLVYSDYQPFSLRASAQPTAGIAGPWTTQLQFAALDATASAQGTMTLAGDFDLQIAAQAAALEKLNALLPQMQLPALHQMTLDTHVRNGPVRGDLPVIGQTRLRFAGADLQDRVPGLKLLAMDMTIPAAGAPASVAGTGSLAGQGFALRGTFGVPEHPDGRVSVPIDLAAEAPVGRIALRGRLALDTGRFDGLDAALTSRLPALAALRPTVSATLPALTDVALDGRLVIPPDAGKLSLHAAKLTTTAGDLAGDATIGLGAALALDAKLHAQRLDLDAVLTAFGWTSGTPGSNAFAAPLPWAALRGPTIELSASVAALTFEQQGWQNVELALQLGAGRLQVSRLQVALPGGPLEMSLAVDAATDAPPVSLTLHAPGIPLALLARNANLPGPASGAVRMDAQLRAAGRSARDLAATLDGPFSATMTAGSITNAALIQLTAASLQALGIQVPMQGDTAIRCFGLIGTFNKGIGRFGTIALNTTYLELAGAGQVDLGAQTVALKLHPLAHLAGSAVSVPVLVEGPFDAVHGRLDASGLDKLGLLIDAWFGGDRPTTCSDAGLVPVVVR